MGIADKHNTHHKHKLVHGSPTTNDKKLWNSLKILTVDSISGIEVVSESFSERIWLGVCEGEERMIGLE